MDSILEKKLMEIFPFMKQRRFFDETNEESPSPIICECGDGWFPLIYSLCYDIEQIYEKANIDSGELEVLQIKEKYGKLHFYIGNCIDGVLEAIEKHEKISLETCEKCGKKGELISENNWLKVRCKKCD